MTVYVQFKAETIKATVNGNESSYFAIGLPPNWTYPMNDAQYIFARQFFSSTSMLGLFMIRQTLHLANQVYKPFNVHTFGEHLFTLR